MISSRLSPVNPKQVLFITLSLSLLVTVLSFGSYQVPEKQLTARRGPLSFIPRDTRQVFVEHRAFMGAAAGGAFAFLAVGWWAAEWLSRAWQKARNRELAANAVLLRIAPRVDEQSKWQAAADLWRAVHSTLARPGWQV